VLGRALSKIGITSQAKIISKISPKLDPCDTRAMSDALEFSLEKIGIPCLYGLMLHTEEHLSQWSKGLSEILQIFVQTGKVKKIGVSVYSPNRALEALDLDELDMIQLPSNILDRRFENAGVFGIAAQKKKQVYIRSVFLQGLILMEPEDLPSNMSIAKPVIERIKSISNELGLTRTELALGYLKAKMPGAKMIMGVDTAEQITENLNFWKRKPMDKLVPIVSENFAQINGKILDPTLWSE
jgi:aryl-alcohol dehydrogenase-like predicted oxidoreductase